MSTYASLSNGGKYLIRLEYSSSEASGITAVVVVSFISLLAVVGLLTAISISAFNTRTSLDQHLFVRMHVAAYFVSLLVGNLLQAIGSIINVSWVAHSRSIQFGDTCTVQGIIKHIADLSMAIWTFAIAIHVFCLLVLGVKIQRVTMIATVVSGWSGTLALVIIGPTVLDTKTRGPYFGISGHWCWITEQYPTERIVLDYLFMFMAALFSLILYLLIFLHFRGVPVLSRWRAYFRETEHSNEDEFEAKGMEIAKRMSLYPVAYSVIVLPIAATRFSSWAGHEISFAVVIFSAILFQMSGIINVALFFTIGRVLPPQSISIVNLKREISRPHTFKPPPPILDPGISDPYYASSELDSRPTLPVLSEGIDITFPEPDLRNHTEVSKDPVPSQHEAEYSVEPLQIRKPRPDMLPDIEVSKRLDSVYDFYEREGRRRSLDSYYDPEAETGRSHDSYKDVDLDDTPIEQSDSDDYSIYSN